MYTRMGRNKAQYSRTILALIAVDLKHLLCRDEKALPTVTAATLMMVARAEV